jgi:hypothetical protein
MTSTYKAQSNRRNAQRSTGPRSPEGKKRVRLNALKHGLCAQTPVLPDESPEAFAQHRDGLMAALRPRDEVELTLAKTFVSAAWKRERCERAETGLISHNMQNAGVEAAKLEQLQVISLGRRLFWDRQGDLRFYPHALEGADSLTSASFMKTPNDPDDPACLVVELEATLAGCRWLLDRWAELKERLLPGMAWQPQDKFKAIRLLGKQPLDAPDEPVVCLILQAAHVLFPRYDGAFFELECEFSDLSLERHAFLGRIEDRPYKAVRPQNEAEARQVLMDLVDEAIARIEQIAAGHEARAAIYAGKAAHRLAFDPSNEAERLRRHERACVRDMFRSLSTLAKVRESELLNDDERDAPADQPDVPAREFCFGSGGGETYQPDTSAYQPDAPARECLSTPSPIASAIEWPVPADGFVAGPLAAESGQPTMGNGTSTTEDGPFFQFKPNAACNGAGESAGHANLSNGCGQDAVEPGARADLSALDLPSVPPSDPGFGPQPPVSPPNSENGDTKSAPPADFAGPALPSATLGPQFFEGRPKRGTWTAWSAAANLTKCLGELADTRAQKRLQWRRQQEDERRRRARKLERKRQREQAQREPEAAMLSPQRSQRDDPGSLDSHTEHKLPPCPGAEPAG